MTALAQLSADVRIYLRTEVEKMRSVLGNPLPLLVLGAPVGFVLLKALGLWARGAGLSTSQRTFWYFISMGQFFWDALLVPLLVMATCSWAVWMDREQGQWKVLLSQPLSRIGYLASKWFLVLVALFWVEILWWGTHLLAGAGLGLDGSEVLPRAALRGLQVWVAMTPLIASQTWLSCRMASPFSAFGVGLLGNTAGMALSGTASNVWHPWGLTHLALRSRPEDWQLSAALLGAVLISIAAGYDFARKDLSS